MEDIIKALKIIATLNENHGEIDCPKCGNKLKYTRAESNGHVWGKCKTPGCLSWAM